jgi:hypothetical protein
MKMKKQFSGLFFISLLVFAGWSCTKDQDGNISQTDIALAKDEAYVDAVYDELDNLAMTEVKTLDENGYSESALKSTFSDVCYTVTVDHPDSTTFPKVITIDFGDGCSTVFNGDTITRSGQIILTITNRWFVPQAQHVMTFNNFYYNGAKVEGTRTITNEGLNNKLRLLISIELENGKITFSNDTFITRNASHMWEWALHMNPFNDTIFVTGTASGKNVLGENYVRTITNPLVMVPCSQTPYRYGIVDGSIDVQNSVRGNFTIDYSGDGCSHEVIIKKGGNQYNYHFQFRQRKHRWN